MTSDRWERPVTSDEWLADTGFTRRTPNASMGYRINHMPDTHFGCPRPTDEERAVTLTEFLLARIAEDEAVATSATSGPWQEDESIAGGEDDWRIEDGHGRDIAGCPDCGVRASFDRPDAAHIARHDPARVLAECEAKRRIVEWCGERQQIWAGSMCEDPTDPAHYVPGPLAHPSDAPVLRMLALPYVDHPDYRPEWKP